MSAEPDVTTEPIKYWNYRYESGNTQWHLEDISPLLANHYPKLNPDGHAKNVLYPMCGMSLDLDWFARDKGFEVVGVDISPKAVENVMARSGKEWRESPAPQLGPEGKLFTRNDGKMKLYAGDMLKFSKEMEGEFDAICDRDGLHVIDPGLRRQYADMIKSLLKPGSRFLLEAIYYDPKILDEADFNPCMKVPPPYSLSPEEVKSLFEPDCSVEHIDKNTYKLLYGKDTDFNAFLIIKK